MDTIFNTAGRHTLLTKIATLLEANAHRYIPGKILPSIIHELNNQLNIMAFALELLEDMNVAGAISDESARRQTQLGYCTSAQERISSLLRALRELSREHQTRLITFDLGSALEELVHLLSCSYKDRVGLTLCRRAAIQVYADPGQVRRAVFELILNALEVSPSGSIVEILSEPIAQLAVIRIADRGPGYSASHATESPLHLESPDHLHLGMGLWLARKTAMEYGGSVTLHQRPDGGSVCTFTLPLVSAGEPTRSA
ncbi:MAG: hypothetical protein A2284_04805 [Deltaproteobacteria bacterium RIFOXYA12_FULL_61_11]|nr:MAG: hypothetical protein A2284_04805 [Deltaproteobacteria bacterium RIFOXYA12_FULL_61_11]